MSCSAINGSGLRNWTGRKSSKPKLAKKPELAKKVKTGFQGLRSIYGFTIASEYPGSSKGVYYAPEPIRDLVKEIYEINHRYCSDMYVSRETEITTDMGNGYTITKYPRTKSFVVSGPNNDRLEVSFNLQSNGISRIKRSDAKYTIFIDSPDRAIEEHFPIRMLSS